MDTAPPADQAQADDRLLDALFAVLAEHGWRGVSVTRLAEASGLAPGVLVRRFPSRLDLLRLHGRRVAEIVAAGTLPGQGGTPRDRIFDVLMRGVDALQPHRAGMQRLMREMRTDPVLAVALGPVLRQAMLRMLDAAEIDSTGARGQLRALGLVGVWLRTLHAWSSDETEDLGPTMAMLDRALERGEQVARSLRLDSGDLAAVATEA
jgi:AcrR family transcriptional regulator